MSYYFGKVLQVKAGTSLNVFQHMPSYKVKKNNDFVPLPLKSLPRYKSEKAMYTKVYQIEQEQDCKKNYIQTIKFRNLY